MSVLNMIAEATRQRVASEKQALPQAELAALAAASRTPFDFKAVFAQPGFQVIAEVKLASPSQGAIAPQLKPVEVARDYLAHGAAALSVLTEPEFFQGNLTYLEAIREAEPEARLLMKDFMLDPYQLYQARVAGADAILLIVAMLEASQLQALYNLALELGLTPLVEVHTASEMEAALALGATLIGVNNRDLKTLQTRLETSQELAQLVPAGTTLICESGLGKGQDLQRAQSWGYHGFLIGTHLMASGKPGLALADLLKQAHNV
jgi:indole-3-glycerol phosphate synthase